ncbi:winged helix DNA-binding domain-containing protein [Umezawaea beigongshangensis]|uniref:winged helix DNA-binding domain-containing protein n=1 Tax=Umezawaea beigongshangensis TaxID=2780383 RepID=UPI0018F27801|nr:winged helix DNA-binding domain-containing protein [Umezawaea beigongshangensis]
MTTQVLTTRVLNRTLLRRQLLLERRDVPVGDAVELLVGLQAQTTNSPYLALWSRLRDFAPDALSELLLNRTAVRTHLMRGTLHLVSAADLARLRPVLQPVLTAALRAVHARGFPDVDLDEYVAAARELATTGGRTAAEFGEHAHARWPGHDARRLSTALPFAVPLVQTPPRGVWGRGGRVAWTPAAHWLGTDVPDEGDTGAVISRYLAVFGPATVADVGRWSRLTGLREHVEEMRPALRVFRDERGRELLDVPDGPIEDADAPAPPRFLPEFDNVLLSHADRTRIVSDEHRAIWGAGKNGLFPASFLVDGFLRGAWRVERDRDVATLVLTPWSALSAPHEAALREEGARLLRFTAPDAEHAMRVTPCP